MFKPTKQLQSQIEQFLNAVSEAAIVFETGVKKYLEKDEINFKAQFDKIKTIMEEYHD